MSSSNPSLSRTQTSEDNQRPIKPVRVEHLEALKTLPENQRLEIEAAAFRRLVEHLQRRSDVQNIDLMNLAGFCRNCLSKWYRAEASERGVDIDDLIAREHVYGMPYQEWKTKYQK